MDTTKNLIDAVKQQTQTPYYQIKLEPDRKPSLTESKIGGRAYWTKSIDYPRDKDDRPLLLLTQINFDQADVKAPLPTKGLLQFFVADDELFGLDFDDRLTPRGFRIIYHEAIDYNVSIEEVDQIGVPSGEIVETSFPIFQETAISLYEGITYMNPYDARFADVVKKISGHDIDSFDFEELRDNLLNEPPYHQMLGYPFFTQDDPRYNDKFARYDTLLLQLDSEGDYLMWGDAGIGNFFINRHDLTQKKFNDVLYNWDCC